MIFCYFVNEKDDWTSWLVGVFDVSAQRLCFSNDDIFVITCPNFSYYPELDLKHLDSNEGRKRSKSSKIYWACPLNYSMNGRTKFKWIGQPIWISTGSLLELSASLFVWPLNHSINRRHFKKCCRYQQCSFHFSLLSFIYFNETNLELLATNFFWRVFPQLVTEQFIKCFTKN